MQNGRSDIGRCLLLTPAHRKSIFGLFITILLHCVWHIALLDLCVAFLRLRNVITPLGLINAISAFLLVVDWLIPLDITNVLPSRVIILPFTRLSPACATGTAGPTVRRRLLANNRERNHIHSRFSPLSTRCIRAGQLRGIWAGAAPLPGFGG